MTEVIDSRTFSRFCRVESSYQIPDGDTIEWFRNILTNYHLILKKGTIVDSTLIAASPSTKKKQWDHEAYQSKKGTNWHFGYKAHIGVDRDTGIVHHLETTAGIVSDAAKVIKLKHWE